MTPDLSRADRAEAVRNAARAWFHAGAVDATTLAVVEASYPDDRVRVGPVFRALLFLFTLLAVSAGFGFVVMAAGLDIGGALAVLALIAGVVLAVATKIQIGALRRRQGGTEAATSLLTVVFLLGAAAWWLFESLRLEAGIGQILFCLLGAALLAAAAWRWGYPLYAGAATAALFVALAHLPGGRLLWIVLPLALAPWLLRLSRSIRLPPAHRDSCVAVASVALIGLYTAIHLGSWESQLVEEIGDRPGASAAVGIDALWWSAVAATALVPAALLVLGIRRRRYPLLLLGLATSVVSLVTIRYYVHVAPLWALLVLSGALLVAVALALRRYLASGADGERHGFTAEPLFDDVARVRLLEAGAAVLALTPDARSLHEQPKLEGGGGQFGGGGASGTF